MILNDIQLNVRASQLHTMMTGNFGLSETQSRDLKALEDRHNDPDAKPLTAKMMDKMADLQNKRDNPTIGETSKSYIKKLVAENAYGMHQEVSSKYLAHGNMSEPEAIQYLQSKVLGIRLKKNEERKKCKTTLLSGEPDLVVPELDAIIDIKCPYDTITFSSNFNDEVKTEYYWQLQAYMYLFEKPTSYLAYFLTENFDMDDQHRFQDTEVLDRVIIKKIDYDQSAIDRYIERIPAIQNFFEEEVLTQTVARATTKAHIMDMRNIINSKAA